ncbi:MAG: lipoyl(octanoyl) transferase LipB [Sandaracinaceae bacterium]|nr:lipoyl(octanoyl) transferase LipB [Sandaracinaceae bacterium]
MRLVRVVRPGLVDYARAHELQEKLQRARQRGAIPDTFLMLEHPPVITLGRGAKHANILYPRELLEREGFTVHEIGRGGDVTYHGPGQLVGYPILDLTPDRKDVRRYVSDLEELMIRLARGYGLEARRVDKLNGTWIVDPERGDRKIGAVGVRISRWVTMHGFAFNVTTDLTHFDRIVPCGIRDRGVTSLREELGRDVPISEAMDRMQAIFAEVFDAELVPAIDPLEGVDERAFAPEPWRDARG